MKKYFLYELNKKLFAIGLITLVCIVYYVAPILWDSFGIYNSFALGYISAIGGVLAAAVPVWMFAYKMKRRSVDLYYSLPLSHTKILAARFLVGLIIVYTPYTVAYWLGAFSVMSKALNEINAVWYVPQYFASIIPIYVIYAMAAFTFTRANKPGDGLAFMLFWTFAVFMVRAVIGNWFGETRYISAYIPVAPLDQATGYFSSRLSGRFNPEYIRPQAEVINMAIGYTITSLLAAGSTVGLLLTEKYAKGENAGQVSDSIFGYKSMIPLYTVCLMAVTSFDGAITLLIVMIALGSLLMTIAYKRTVKLDKKQLIILGITLAVGLILALINTLLIQNPDPPMVMY